MRADMIISHPILTDREMRPSRVDSTRAQDGGRVSKEACGPNKHTRMRLVAVAIDDMTAQIIECRHICLRGGSAYHLGSLFITQASIRVLKARQSIPLHRAEILLSIVEASDSRFLIYRGRHDGCQARFSQTHTARRVVTRDDKLGLQLDKQKEKS